MAISDLLSQTPALRPQSWDGRVQGARYSGASHTMHCPARETTIWVAISSWVVTRLPTETQWAGLSFLQIGGFTVTVCLWFCFYLLFDLGEGRVSLCNPG